MASLAARLLSRPLSRFRLRRLPARDGCHFSTEPSIRFSANATKLPLDSPSDAAQDRTQPALAPPTFAYALLDLHSALCRKVYRGEANTAFINLPPSGIGCGLWLAWETVRGLAACRQATSSRPSMVVPDSWWSTRVWVELPGKHRSTILLGLHVERSSVDAALVNELEAREFDSLGDYFHSLSALLWILLSAASTVVPSEMSSRAFSR